MCNFFFQMSVKRRPDTELNHDNWDEEPEAEQFGEFEKANDDELKSRVIKTAKRRLGSGSDTPKTSIFSTFQGFGSTSGADSSSKPLFQFGGTSTNSTAPSTSIFGNTAAKTTFSFGANNGNSSPLKTNIASPAKATEKSVEFCSKLKELNKAVLDCIKGHIDSGKLCILTPIFKDYIKYIDEIESSEKKTPTFETKSTTPTEDATKKSNLIFGSSGTLAAKPSSTEDSAKKSDSLFSSVSLAKSDSSTPSFTFSKPFASFSSSPAAGTASTSTTGTTSGPKPFFSFSQPPKAEGSAATENKNNENTAEGAEENEEPPKNEFKPVVEEESIYSKRCKVFVKTNDDYASRGTGTLYLKSVQNGKIQLIVRADTNLGNILLNVLLGAGIPVKRMGKNNVMLICIPTPDAGPKPSSVLLRVKNEDDADELYAELNKHLK